MKSRTLGIETRNAFKLFTTQFKVFTALGKKVLENTVGKRENAGN